MQVLFLKNVEHWKPMPRRNDSIIALEVNWHYLKGEKWPHQYFRVVAAIVKLAQNPNAVRGGICATGLRWVPSCKAAPLGDDKELA